MTGFDGVFQCFGDTRLSHYCIKGLWPVFSGGYDKITHCTKIE